MVKMTMPKGKFTQQNLFMGHREYQCMNYVKKRCIKPVGGAVCLK